MELKATKTSSRYRRRMVHSLASLFVVIALMVTSLTIMEQPVKAEVTKRTTALTLTKNLVEYPGGSANPSAQDMDALATEGWAWHCNGATIDGQTYTGKVLELDGINLETSESPALKLPSSTTIVLKGTNNIACTATTEDSYGIFGKGITIEGSGSMTVTCGDTSGINCPIYSQSYNIEINGGTINAYGGTSGDSSISYGMKTDTFIRINGGTLNAISGSAGMESYGAQCTTFNVTGGQATIESGSSRTGKISSALYLTNMTANPNLVIRNDSQKVLSLDASSKYYNEYNSETPATKIIATATPEIRISTQPVSPGMMSPGKISGSLTVVGSTNNGGTISYQWYSNTVNNSVTGTIIDGATSATYTIPTNLGVGIYYYYCKLSAEGYANLTSNRVAVKIGTEIMIGTQPQSISSVQRYGNVKGSFTTAGTASDSGTVSYQWYSNTSSDYIGGSKINGATSATYMVPTDLKPGYHYYYCVLSAANADDVYTEIVYTYILAEITIKTQPVSPKAMSAGNISGSLTVGATATGGIEVLNYQWYSSTSNSIADSTRIDGATNATYAIPKNLSEGTYYYFCVISGTDCNPVPSDFATVKINKADPVVTTVTKVAVSPTSASVLKGGTKTFSAKVTGTGSPSQEVTWSVSGNKSKNTKITSAGKLTVGSDETATALTIKAVSKDNTKKFGTAKVNVAAKKGTKFTTGNFTYKITNEKTNGSGAVTLTGIAKGKTVTTLTVPATTKYNGVTYKVSAIGEKAFYKNKKIKKAIIGNNVVTIGKNAFRECTKLTTVTVGNKVTTISYAAFMKCGSLKTVTIGTGLKKFENHVFCLARKLATVNIKSTKLTSVGNHALNEVSNLKIKVPASKVKAYKKLFAKTEKGKNVTVVKL